ncbi:MAG: acyl-CoA dehydrogenase family protein [Dehalococcoidia bacterium]
MDFTLTEEQQILRRTVHDFAVKELAPSARERDALEEFPWDAYRGLAQLGLTGLGISPDLGGAGGGLVETAVVIEELARVDPSTSLSFLASHSLTTLGIARFADDAQRQKYVPPLARGEVMGAFAYTEPDAGSDAAAIATTAVRGGDGYVLNGTKIFITNGDIAETFLAFATENRGQRHRGIVAFIVERGFPGVETSKQHDKLGMRSSGTAEVFFRDCRVPAENRVGGDAQGFKIGMQVLEGSRPIIGAQAVGIAQGAFDLALRQVRQRKQFGQTLSEFQGVQWMLADMATRIDASRLLVYRAASLRDQDQPSAKESSMAKLFASETAMHVASTALQLHGGYGYFKESPVERFFRDAKVTEIYEGTSQIQRLVIAREILAEQTPGA